MAEFTTMEIAFRTRKSERQVQRWIQSGKLPAIHLQGNVYEVNENDLTPFLPREVVTDLVERIASLESRVHTLEATITAMSNNSYASHKPTPRLLHERSEASESSTLPDGWMSLFAFCDLHNIAETTARRYLNPEMIKKGTWEHDHSLVKVALDSRGQHHLWNIFHNKTRFKPCDRCPH